MEIKYQLFETNKLIVQKFIGVFSLKDYMRYNGHIGRSLSSNSINKVLIDFRDLLLSEDKDGLPDEIDEKLDEIVKIRKKINETEHKNKKVNLVILVDKPLPTAIAHMFVNNFSHANYNYCSTASKAISILEIPFNSESLYELLANLENTFGNN